MFHLGESRFYPYPARFAFSILHLLIVIVKYCARGIRVDLEVFRVVFDIILLK
jgi:hypothetical protein